MTEQLNNSAVEIAAEPTVITLEGKAYHFVMGFAEACTLEEKLGHPFSRILSDFSDEPSLVVLREVFRTALRPANSDAASGQFGVPMARRVEMYGVADRLVAALGVERGADLVALHLARILGAILNGIGGVEIAGSAEPEAPAQQTK